MKIFGSITELFTLVFRKGSANVTLKPDDSQSATITVTIPQTSSNDSLVLSTAPATLANKTISGDSNTLTNIAAGSLKAESGSANTVLLRAATTGAVTSGTISNVHVNASAAIADSKLATISTAGKVSNSATTAASSNTASAIVARDASGNFSAGTITATFSGNLTGNVTGNVSGTAGNITATSNSTLTSLSSLSLPGSQVSGNISGNAANVTGTVAIANGGTGQTTANAALNALLPSQSTQTGKVLQTDGTNVSWQVIAPSPTTLTDAEATRLGLKTYLSSTAYNAGITPTITSSFSKEIVSISTLIPYQTQGGSWRLKGSIPRTQFSNFYSNVTQVVRDPFISFGSTFGPPSMNTLEIQSDGKLLVGGNFTGLNNSRRGRLVRLNSDGTEDTAFTRNLIYSFTTPTATSDGFSNQVVKTAVQSDGKILVGGQFTAIGGRSINRLVRLNSDGTEDTAFTTNIGTAFGSAGPSAFGIQSDGKILVGGSFTTFNGNTRNGLVRLNSSGTEDTAFYINMGTGTTGQITDIVIQSDGKLIVGGFFTTFNGLTRNQLVRLNSNGTEDTAFYTNLGTGFSAGIRAVVAQTDGKLLIGGDFTTLNGIIRNYLVRLNSDGTVDTAFYTNLGTGFNGSVYAVAVQSDGKILVCGTFTTLNGVARNKLVRLNSNGTVDTTFSTNMGDAFTQTLQDVAIQSDGKIVTTGTFFLFNSLIRSTIIRLDSDGTEDNGPPSLTYTINGVQFSSASAEIVTGFNSSGATSVSGSTISFASPVGGAILGGGCTFDVALASKPTWAY